MVKNLPNVICKSRGAYIDENFKWMVVWQVDEIVLTAFNIPMLNRGTKFIDLVNFFHKFGVVDARLA